MKRQKIRNVKNKTMGARFQKTIFEKLRIVGGEGATRTSYICNIIFVT